MNGGKREETISRFEKDGRASGRCGKSDETSCKQKPSVLKGRRPGRPGVDSGGWGLWFVDSEYTGPDAYLLKRGELKAARASRHRSRGDGFWGQADLSEERESTFGVRQGQGVFCGVSCGGGSRLRGKDLVTRRMHD